MARGGHSNVSKCLKSCSSINKKGLVAIANFHGVNTPTMANFKLFTWHHRLWVFSSYGYDWYK